MDSNPETIDENTSFLTIAQIFLNQPRRRLPVVKGSRLVGQVSRRDVIRAAAKSFTASVEQPSTLLYLSALREMTDPPAV
jgi:CBS domain-containing protein